MKKKLLFSLILAFFLMSICMSVSEVVTAEQANLRESKYVEVAPEHVYHEKVSGMVKNGSEVSISVVLTNFSKVIEGNKSELFFYSDLGVLPSIIVDGTPKEYKIPFVVDHRKVREVKVTLVRDAPEVNKRRENVTLLNITQKIKEEEYSVIDIKRHVTSEIIEDALSAWHKAEEAVEAANLTITNATKAKINVEEAKTTLKLAKEHLNNSLDFYNGGRPEEALREAELASVSAGDAKKLAESVKGARRIRNYGILAAVVIIAVVVLGLWAKKRSKKRRIY